MCAANRAVWTPEGLCCVPQCVGFTQSALKVLVGQFVVRVVSMGSRTIHIHHSQNMRSSFYEQTCWQTRANRFSSTRMHTRGCYEHHKVYILQCLESECIFVDHAPLSQNQLMSPVCLVRLTLLFEILFFH